MEKKEFDRSRFKGAKLSKLKEVQQEAEKKDVRLLGGSYDGRASFHSVEEGRNEFRLMPPHDPENEPAYRALRTSQLECEVPVYADGKETDKVELKTKKIFIATQHGNEALRKLGKDPIELYIKYIGDEAGLIDDKDDRQKFLAPVKGYRGKDGKWVWGIMPSTTYVAYALKEEKLGRLELYDAWRKELDKIVIKIEEEEEQVIDYDPFSDPDEGYPIFITKGKNDKGKWEYMIDRINPKKRQSWEDFCEENRITDTQLKELYEKESLTELYVDVYTKKDFDLAVDGLRRFDKKWKFNIFENEEFLQELDEIEKVVPEPKPVENSDAELEQNFKKAESNTSTWPKVKCKKQLKAYVLGNYDGSEQEDYLQFIDSTDDLALLREWCELSVNEEELPEIPSPETEDEQGGDVGAPEDTDHEEGSNEDEELEKVISNRSRRRG